MKGQIQTLILLLKEGANINAIDNLGNTPLYPALYPKKEEAAIFLIEQGASIHNQMDEPLETAPLDIAARFGFNNVIQKLIQGGANINIQDAAGCSALHFSALSNHVETSKYLIQGGANVNVKNIRKETPIYLAIYNNHLKVIDFLVNHGAYLEIKSEGLNTPLLLAAQCLKSFQMVKLFIEKGADLNTRGDMGLTPLHIRRSVTERAISRHFRCLKNRQCLYLRVKRNYLWF